MAVAAPVKSFTDTAGVRLQLYPCLCLDYPMSFNTAKKQRRHVKKLRQLELSSTFTSSSPANKMLTNSLRKRQKKPKGLIIVDDLGGQYDDTFVDVKIQIMNYFTAKAVQTVLDQLYETNTLQHNWFNCFIEENSLRNGKQFLQILVKERRDFAERVMITRLALYSRWIKKCDHEETYKEIEEENLMLMRERLLETVVWPSDDHTNPNNPNPNPNNAD